MPLHRRLALIGWTCAALFIAILVSDQACKLLHMPRVEQWPFFGAPLTLLALPLVAGTVLCSIAASLFKRHHRITRAHFTCPTCDYDRRGLSLDAPCPECGAAPNA